jgi:AAA domain
MDRLPHPSVTERLARLAPDQRAAATSPPGPLLVVAPAGSGKTTTLVARVAWLVDGGTDPATITVVAFNKRAAEELTERIDAALAPLGHGPAAVLVRTFHALGREILAEAGVDVAALSDRDARLRALWPQMPAADRGRLDLAFSRLKLDLRVRVEDVAADPAAGPVARAWVAYEQALREDGALDFDDLVVRALGLLESDAALLVRWRARTSTLLVDEAQDLDRTQLDLALLLAGPGRSLCAVGDDDQTVYRHRTGSQGSQTLHPRTGVRLATAPPTPTARNPAPTVGIRCCRGGLAAMSTAWRRCTCVAREPDANPRLGRTRVVMTAASSSKRSPGASSRASWEGQVGSRLLHHGEGPVEASTSITVPNHQTGPPALGSGRGTPSPTSQVFTWPPVGNSTLISTEVSCSSVRPWSSSARPLRGRARRGRELRGQASSPPADATAPPGTIPPSSMICPG